MRFSIKVLIVNHFTCLHWVINKNLSNFVQELQIPIEVGSLRFMNWAGSPSGFFLFVSASF